MRIATLRLTFGGRFGRPLPRPRINLNPDVAGRPRGGVVRVCQRLMFRTNGVRLPRHPRRGTRRRRSAADRRTSVALLFLPVLSLACGPAEGTGGDGLERFRTRGLRAGFAIEPPYAFVDSAGSPTGEAPAILEHVAGELGIADIQWFPLPFHDLIPALNTGRVDALASGLFITPERSGQVRFSRPTACVAPVLISRRRDDVLSAPAPEGSGCARCRIAVIQGSVEERALERWERAEVVSVPDLATATAAVSDASADALVISAPTARGVVRRHLELAVREDVLPAGVRQAAAGCAALAFRRRDEELVAAVDSVLQWFVGSRVHLRLVTPFGFTEAELPCPGAAPPDGPPRADSCEVANAGSNR